MRIWFFKNKQKDPPICDGCGEQMTETDMPVEVILWRIPFTSYEIRLWDWQVVHQCAPCAMQSERNQRDEIAEGAYDAGYEKGYSRAMRDERY